MKEKEQNIEFLSWADVGNGINDLARRVLAIQRDYPHLIFDSVTPANHRDLASVTIAAMLAARLGFAYSMRFGRIVIAADVGRIGPDGMAEMRKRQNGYDYGKGISCAMFWGIKDEPGMVLTTKENPGHIAVFPWEQPKPKGK